MTARDSVVINLNNQDLLAGIRRFADERFTDDQIRSFFFPGKIAKKYLPGDTRGWKLPIARARIRENDHEELIKPIDYRPFDTRAIYYSEDMVDWGRQQLTSNILGRPNICLAFTRRIEQKRDFADVFVFENMIQHHSLSIKEVNYFAPLYLYRNDGTATPNFKPEILARLTENLVLIPSPFMVLDYIYAILHSPTYRAQYDPFLRDKFPCVPVPTDDEQFKKLTNIGEKLRELHLMKSSVLHTFITTYPISGNDEVEKLTYTDGKVWINDRQYFGDVPLIAWNFYIGGYQPAQKWLKDRKGATLSNQDIEHYQRIIKALSETHRLMNEVDGALSKR